MSRSVGGAPVRRGGSNRAFWLPLLHSKALPGAPLTRPSHRHAAFVEERRDEIETRVLHALQEKLLRRALFEELCEEFTREVNRLRMAARASITATERELRRLESEIAKLIQALKDGVPAGIVKHPLIAVEAQQQIRARVSIGQLNHHHWSSRRAALGRQRPFEGLSMRSS